MYMKNKVYLSGINNYYNEVYIENALVKINQTINFFEYMRTKI